MFNTMTLLPIISKVVWQKYRHTEKKHLYLTIIIYLNLYHLAAIALLFMPYKLIKVIIDTRVFTIMSIFNVALEMYLFIRNSPLFDRTKHMLSTVDVIEGTDEMIVFLDDKDNVCYYHNGTDIDGLPEQIFEIVKQIRQNHVDLTTAKNGNCDVVYQGELNTNFDKMRILKYKANLLFDNSNLIGFIVMLRDVTEFKELLRDLNQKNLMLQEAFQKQKEYVRVEQQLLSENERAKILEKINSVAGDYLREFKSRVSMIEQSQQEHIGDSKLMLIEHSEEMLKLTQNAIEGVRQTVYGIYTRARREGEESD